MFCLSNLSINKIFVPHAISPDNNSQQHPIHNPSAKPSLPSTKPQSLPRKPKLPLKRRQPSNISLQRIVGAGSFRDGEPEDLEKMRSTLDLLSKNAFESSLEKQLRETGEWLSENTETKFRSSGKSILMFMVQWMLPIWAFSLIFASGMIKLPFSSTFLDDLIL